MNEGSSAEAVSAGEAGLRALYPRLPRTSTLRVTLSALAPCTLPGWLGSTLHGALGQALARVPAGEASAFDRLMAPAAPRERLEAWLRASPPSPLALVPPPPGDARPLSTGEHLRFSVVLIGADAIALAELVGAGLHRMARYGLGRDQARFELASVEGPARVACLFDEWRGAPGDDAPLPPALDLVRRLTLHARRPLHLRVGGEMTEQPDFATIIGAAARRALALTAYFGDGAPPLRVDALMARATAAVHRETGTFERYQTGRWSSRQKRRHPVTGMTGQLTVEGDLTELAPLLAWCARVGIGKGAALGLGGYELTTD
ncbi:MAG: CRISPR system precrRNA processing endoribonuclease RAMP protein Cas6 [Myxococcales bacterium]|nr:CRISPR system precrRNA processing endoribonuclease RAMP protein Cas6 [Myxococcales bacterium]